MKITVKQLKQLIREEIQIATSRKMRRLYENEEAQEMPSKQEVIAAAEDMTPGEAKQVVKDAGIDMRALLQNPEIRALIDQAAEKIEENQSAGASTGIDEERGEIALSAAMFGVPTILYGLMDMGIFHYMGHAQQYAPDAYLVGGHGPGAVVMAGIALTLAGFAAQRAFNKRMK